MTDAQRFRSRVAVIFEALDTHARDDGTVPHEPAELTDGA